MLWFVAMKGNITLVAAEFARWPQ